MTEHYIQDEAYLAAVNAIALRWNLDPDDVKIAMGEGGNVWPASMLARHMLATNSVHMQSSVDSLSKSAPIHASN
jgi:hypothetical protein